MDFKIMNAARRRRRVVFFRFSPKHGPDSCQKHAGGKGFDDVIGGTQFQACDNIGFLAFCREHDRGNGPGGGVRLQRFHHLKTVDPGQHEVQND